MVRRVCFHETGGPDVLTIENVDIATPGPGELRVKIEAIGLNRAEAMFRSGAYLEPPQLPAGIGYEASAEVISCGEGVDQFKPGQSVSIIPAFSMNHYSVYADEAIVPAYAVFDRPEGIDAVSAAAVWMAYLTSWGALVDIAGVTEGDVVVITAASSSVGLAAIQMANSLGAVSVAATRTPAKVDALKGAGAQHVIVTEEQDLAAEVQRIAGDTKGARVTFDPVGGPALETLAEAASPKGIIIEYGALSTEPTPFPLFAALQKGLTIRGYTLFEFLRDPAKLQAAHRFITDGLQSNALTPIVARTFKLDDIVEAHRFLESNEQFGKIVVTT